MTTSKAAKPVPVRIPPEMVALIDRSRGLVPRETYVRALLEGMLKTIPRYAFLAFQFNSLLDQGQSTPIEEAHSRIHDGSLFDGLEEQYRGDPYYLDLSLYDEDRRRTILKVFESLSDNVDADRKMGVVHNGLALCLAYCIEVMQHPEAYDEHRFEQLTEQDEG